MHYNSFFFNGTARGKIQFVVLLFSFATSAHTSSSKCVFQHCFLGDFFVYFSGWTQLSGRKSKHLESLHLLEIPAKSLEVIET